jgi:peptide/nickel transport system substrate-binding protein
MASCFAACAAADVPAAAPPANSVRQVAEAGTFLDLDPSASCVGEHWVLANVYETLTRYAPPGSAEIVRPLLATSWAVAEDGLTWTFHLRHDVQFHDGTPLTAAAVKFSIERNRDRNACSGYLYDPVSAIETPDAHTVVLRLRYPAPLDLILSSTYAAWIMSPSVAEREDDWFAANDAGSGPYRIIRYEPGQRLVIGRFGDYWGGWQPGQIEQVVFELVEDAVAVEQMLAAGQLDFATINVLSAEQITALDSSEHLRMDVTPGGANELILLNHRRAPTDNPLVRQALAYSYPYEDVIAATYGGRGSRAHGAVPVTVWGHNPSASRYTFDLNKARTLLAAAGYEDGLELTFAYDPGQDVHAELWQAALAEIGVTLHLARADWAIRWETQKSDPVQAPHAYMLSWFPDVVGPYSYLFSMFHSEDSPVFNLGFYSDPAFDALIEEGNILSGSDRAAAGARFIAAEGLLAADAAAIFIQDVPDMHVIAEDLQGYVSNPAYTHVVFWYEVKEPAP